MFKLLISGPIELNEIDTEDSTVNEALQTIYSGTKAYAVYLKWNNYIVELGLNAEIADIFSDIIKMMDGLRNQKEFSIYWGSSSFFATWAFIVDTDHVKIKADWTSLRGPKEILEEIRKVPNQLIISKKEFMNEWLELLSVIKKDLQQAGYDKELLKDLHKLEDLEKYRS